MNKARNRHTNNTLIGAGECFIDELDENESTEGERYLGDTSSGVLRIETEEITVVAGDGATPRALARVVSNIAHSFEVNLQDLSPENLALFVLGDDGKQADKETSVARANGRMTVKPGHWYQLGSSDSCPPGVGSVKDDDFSVHNSKDDGTPFYKATTFTDGRVNKVGDYTLDKDAGRLYIEPGGNITASNPIYVAYTPVAQTMKTVVVAGARKQLKAAFRYVEDATQGRGHNYYAPVALIRPGGDMALKDRAAAQSLTLNIEVLQPANGALAPLYINQQPLSPSA